MRAPTARVRRLIAILVSPVAILVAGLLVWQGSSAAFTAQTRNTGNSWETGSVLLSDDDMGVAGISIINAVPGQSGSKCIVVTSTSSTPGTVKTFIERVGAQGLENNILISFEKGTGGTFANCTGFVADEPPLPAATLALAGANFSTYATGALPWVTTGNSSGESKTYRVSWVFSTTGLSQTAIDALQGKSASADVVWELQTN